jgi:hypothetical protein
LIKKDQPFSWGVEVDNVFQYLKAYFMFIPILIHVNPSKPFVLEMEAFDFVAGTVFSELGEKIFFIMLASILISFLL